MPSLEEHCRNTFKKYGKEGRDIHEWLDDPARIFGRGHRQFRHGVEAIKLVGEIFGEKYGRGIAENIALDHIILDESPRRTRTVKGFDRDYEIEKIKLQEKRKQVREELLGKKPAQKIRELKEQIWKDMVEKFGKIAQKRALRQKKKEEGK